MANREGLTLNDEYQIFVDILQEAVHVFETDRQGFYREYMRWHNEIEKSFGKDANIRADAIANAGVRKNSKTSGTNSGASEESASQDTDDKNQNRENKYTDEEYQETVYQLIQEMKGALNAKQILQMLSSSGLILNTFFMNLREFRLIMAQERLSLNIVSTIWLKMKIFIRVLFMILLLFLIKWKLRMKCWLYGLR